MAWGFLTVPIFIGRQHHCLNPLGDTCVSPKPGPRGFLSFAGPCQMHLNNPPILLLENCIVRCASMSEGMELHAV
jgi:hypothetical protein